MLSGCGGGGGGDSTATPTPSQPTASSGGSTITTPPRLSFTADGARTLEQQTQAAASQLSVGGSGSSFYVTSLNSVVEDRSSTPRRVWRLFYNSTFVINRNPGTDIPAAGTIVLWEFGNEVAIP